MRARQLNRPIHMALIAIALVGASVLPLRSVSAAPTQLTAASIVKQLSGGPTKAFAWNNMDKTKALRTLEQIGGVLERHGVQNVLDAVPREQRDRVVNILDRLKTPEGRIDLLKEIDSTERDSTIQGAVKAEKAPATPLATPSSAASTFSTSTPKDPQPTFNLTTDPRRSTTPSPSAKISIPDPPNTCPVSPGILPTPTSMAPGTILLPRTNTFLSNTTTPTVVHGDGDNSNQNDAIIFGNKVLVRVHLDSIKHFPVDAYDVVLRVRTLGNTAQETQVYPTVAAQPRVTGHQRHCYSTSVVQGYWEGWLELDPAWENRGFQITAEVVEFDPYFSCDFFSAPYYGQHCELGLQGWGAQFFAGGDRSTIHVGGNPVAPDARADDGLGLYLTNAGEDISDDTTARSVLTNRDNTPYNDTELIVRDLASQATKLGAENFHRSFVFEPVLNALTSSELDWTVNPGGGVSLTGGDTDQLNFWETMATAAGMTTAAVISIIAEFRVDSVSVGTPIVDVLTETIPPTDEDRYQGQQSDDHWMRLNMEIPSGHLDGALHFFTVNECTAGLDIDASASVEVAPISKTNEVEVLPFGSANVHLSDLDMEWYDWVRPGCILGWALAKAFGGMIAGGSIISTVTDLISEKVGGMLDAAPLDNMIGDFDVNGAPTEIAVGTPHATCQDSICDDFGSLLTPKGFEAVADLTATTGSDPQSPGRFPWVESPAGSTSANSMVRTHRDPSGAVSALGAFIPIQSLNQMLRHLTQGTSTTLTTSGLLNQVADLPFGSPPWTITSFPTVAPFFSPEPAANGGLKLIIPDLRIDIDGDPYPGPSPIETPNQLKANLVVDVALAVNSSGILVPSLSVNVDLTSINCLVNYDILYAQSYSICGEGGDLSIPAHLNDIINYIGSTFAQPLIADVLSTIDIPGIGDFMPEGPIQMGSNTLTIPNLEFDLSNIRIAHNGTHLGVYADVGPRPYLAINHINLNGPGHLYIEATAYNLPGTGAVQFQWHVQDLYGPTAFDIAGVPGIIVSTANLTPHPLGIGSHDVRGVLAQVAASRGGVTISGEHVAAVLT
jgi:hypothetical protein